MSVALPASQRGTHMSRFVAGLEALTARGGAFDLDGHYAFAEELTRALDAATAEITAEFTWFRTVKAPVSGLSARLDAEVAFGARTGAAPRKTLMVRVAAKSLCPCSKAISDRGAHNQRSDIKVTLELAPAAPVPSLDKILTLVETSASSPVYPLLKREDEKHVTESAYDNPVFVEDLVRNVAAKLADLPALAGFVVEAVNRESIHAHDCYARLAYARD
jgi:MptA/FolE2 family GTP cyclohydrolase